MKKFAAFTALIFGAWLPFNALAQDDADHVWHISSPDHEQTFVYGMEANRVWKQWGHHLALLLNYTNDPFVDRSNPREYDNFRFDFPQVRMGNDGHTFYFHASDGRLIPVAQKRPGFLGIDQVQLLPNASLIIDRPHGYLSLTLLVEDIH